MLLMLSLHSRIHWSFDKSNPFDVKKWNASCHNIFPSSGPTNALILWFQPSRVLEDWMLSERTKQSTMSFIPWKRNNILQAYRNKHNTQVHSAKCHQKEANHKQEVRSELVIIEIEITIKVKWAVTNIIKQHIIAIVKHSFEKVIKDQMILWWHVTGRELVDIGHKRRMCFAKTQKLV